MSNMSEDIQCAGSDTRPPMLDRTDFESWQQRIRSERTEGAVQQGLAVCKSPHNAPFQLKKRKGIKLTFVQQYLLQGIPKDIYSLINHYTDAKDIWENVKKQEGLTVQTKDDREKTGYNIDDGCGEFTARMIWHSMWTMSLKLNEFMSNHARPVVHDSEDTREIAEITRKRMLLKMQSPLCVETPKNLTPEQIFWSIDDNNRKKAETLAPKPISALTVYPPNTPVKLVPRVLLTKSVTEGERGFEQTKRCYLTEVIPFFKTLKEHFVGVQTALFKEVKEMEEIFDQMNNEVDKNTVDKQCAEIVKKNLLIENENLIANCLSTQLLYDVQKSRCLDLEADMSKVHNESKHISKLEREYLNLQLKYQHLQESFDNKNSHTSQEAPDFNSFFKIKNLEHQIQEKDNVIRDLKVLVANVNDRSCEPYNAKDVTALIEQNDCVRVELEKVKQHYKELYDSIKITRTHTSEKTSTMLNEIESLKAQLRSKESCFTSDYVKPKVLAPGMYAIDVKPIPHPLKNNRKKNYFIFLGFN
ncbi:hypothetical protein Tco_0646030 [Tanacetum coccineum]